MKEKKKLEKNKEICEKEELKDNIGCSFPGIFPGPINSSSNSNKSLVFYPFQSAG